MTALTPQPLAPSGFTVCDLMPGGLQFACTRPQCKWSRDFESCVHLSELATLAVEHVRETHQ